MNIQHDRLKQLVSAIFAAAGCGTAEAERISHYLVEANLVGHDSHGVLRVPEYIGWLRDGKVLANQHLQTVFENDAIAIVDGQFGFGQIMGEQAMQLGIEKSTRHGVAVVALRNSGHLGRIGEWALMAARAGKISLHFVNTSGGGMLVAPFGGSERRLSANPITAGVSFKEGSPIVLDISTCTIAEGKIRVALNQGISVPDDCLVDGQGQPTNDPQAFYATPPGAILPFGGHKGYGLSIITELLAGALTGGGCSTPNVTRLSQGMLTIILDPTVFQTADEFFAEVNRFIAWVKSSKTVTPAGEILAPGEIEERTRLTRLENGIALDNTTWNQILETARSLNIPQDYLDAVMAA